MATARRRPTARSTAESIKQYIIDHALRPGDLMPTESELCEALSVSRSSVREAVRTLASLDIVEVRHGHGTYVGAMSLAPLVNGMVFRLSLDEERTLKSLVDVVQTRIALDLMLADEVVELHRGGHDRELHRLVETMRTRAEEGQSFFEEDKAFHARLLADVDNAVISELAGAFWEINMRALPGLGHAPPQDIAATVDAHAAMLRACEDGDAQAYRDAVHEHYAPLRRSIRRRLEASDATDLAAALSPA